MMGRRRIASLTAALALLASGIFAANAGAAFHLIKVSEIHSEAGIANDYYEFQMYADGQNFLTGHHVRIFDGAGMAIGDYPIPTNVANGQSQRTFTVGNTALSDFNYGGASVIPAGGAVCWNETGTLGAFGGLDCVSWGNYTPGAEALSSPAGANAPAIPDGQSLQRKLTPGCATLLEAGDDTNNSAADFVVGAPTPRNNSVAPTEKACTGAAKAKKCKKKKKGKGKSGAAAAKKKCKKKKKKKK
jgi:hypothetical protein